MDEGAYVGWIDFEITVDPAAPCDFTFGFLHNGSEELAEELNLCEAIEDPIADVLEEFFQSLDV